MMILRQGIITQGNARTSDGECAGVLLRPKPTGFGLSSEQVGRAERYLIRGTNFADARADYVECELYEAEADTPFHTERISGY